MYANKRSGRRSSDEAVHQVLLRVAAEHDGELRDHVDDVAELAEAVGRELGLDAADAARGPPRRRAARHRQGRDPRRDPARPARARRRASGSTCASTRSSASASSPPRPSCTAVANDRPLQPRALRRRRLPRRARGGGDPARRPDRRRLRHLRRDRHRPRLPRRPHPRGGARRAPALRRHAVRPRVVTAAFAALERLDQRELKACERGVSAVCGRCERPAPMLGP